MALCPRSRPRHRRVAGVSLGQPPGRDGDARPRLSANPAFPDQWPERDEERDYSSSSLMRLRLSAIRAKM